MATNAEQGGEVLVIGAGPVGLTMGCELARHGVRCRVVDADEGPTDQSRALGIQARTLEVFEDVGVVDAVLQLAKKIRGIGVFADGHPITHVTFDLDGMETNYPYLLVLPQADTERILLARLKEHGVEVERRTSLRGLTQDETGVTATLVDAEGRASEVRAPWVIGCDGARSVVRKAVGLTFEGADYEESFLLADVGLAWDRPEDEMTILLTPEGPVIAFPLPEPGRCRLVHASTQPVTEADTEPARVVARFEALLREHGRPEAALSDPGWTSAFRIHRRVVDRFRQGRCFVAGDAAHIHSPAGGQGMNTGIQDAYNLAWKLGLVTRGAALDSLLDSYSEERRPVVAGVVGGSDLLTRVVTLRNPVARSIRDHALGLLGEFGFVARRISRAASELDVEYQASPIVGEDWGGASLAGLADSLDFRAGPRPGDRVPDVRLEPPDDQAGPLRLFELLRGTKHVLLLFEGEHGDPGPDAFESVIELARRHAAEVETLLVARGDVTPPSIAWDGPVVRDHLGELHHRFGARGSCLYLIRPDSYLGYRAVPPDAAKLEAYFLRISMS
jgi:2-polyprenyl-6-methoxyphenol hydroxylase-like FAD-dependent oxidoreductase